MRKRFFRGWTFELEFFIALLLVLPLAVIFFQQSGLPNTADAEIHLHRMISAAANLQAGYLWPRWTPYLHHGFGYPIHNFYAPGLHLIGGGLFLLTHMDGVLVWKLLQTAALLLYPAGAYLFARTFTGRRGALVAAVVYTYAPFRFDELWQQSNLSQFAAMAIIPFLFRALALGSAAPRRAAIAKIGLWFAAIVLLHHPTGFLVAPFAGLYALWLGLGEVSTTQRKRLQRVSLLIAGLALGVALSAVFWLPALGEFRYVQIQRIEQGAFNAATNLIPLQTLLRPLLPIDQTQQNFARFFTPGQPQALFALLGFIALWPASALTRRARLNILFGAFAFLICLFLMTPASAWIWQNLPIARFVVYPWRLLGVAALAAIPGAAIVPSLFPRRWQSGIAAGIIAIVSLAALPLLYTPISFYTVGELTPGEAFIYEKRTGNVGLTSGNEYLPIWAEERPISGNPRDHLVLEWRVDLYDESLPEDMQSERVIDGCSTRQTCYKLDVPQPFTLQFNQMYYPGWLVTLDDQPIEVRPEGIHGLVTLDMPAGAHHLTIEYAGTPLQHAAEVISLISLVIAAGLLLTGRKDAEELSDPDPATTGLALSLGVVLVVFTLVNTAYLLPQTDFMRPIGDPRHPPAQTATSITFDSKVILVGYDLSATQVKPGDTITLTLYWLLEQPVERLPHVALQLVDNVTGDVWARAESPGLAGQNPQNWPLGKYATETFTLSILPDAPPYLPELRLALYDVDPNLHYWPTTEGQDYAVLTPIRILGDGVGQAVMTPIKVTWENSLSLQGYFLLLDANDACITLRWFVETPPSADLSVMLHLLDANGQMITAADAAPLGNRYPTALWLKGQTLDDAHCFALPAEAATLAVGLYRQADVVALPITRSESLPEGVAVDGSALLIPIKR
jgi:hypothetical protein